MCAGLERAHMGIFTELGVLYAKYRPVRMVEAWLCGSMCCTPCVCSGCQVVTTLATWQPALAASSCRLQYRSTLTQGSFGYWCPQERLMEHLKLFSTRLNVPQLIRVCEELELWKELTFL